MKSSILLSLSLCLAAALAQASCPLDHLLIGRNPDGIIGTDDDLKLYIDITGKYRTSDPNNMDAHTWQNWHYPMFSSQDWGVSYYSIGQPGFEPMQNDPNRTLPGQLNIDYKLYIECLDISPGLEARNALAGITLTQPGQAFCYSCQSDHLHLTYRLPDAVADPNQTYWIAYRVYDEFETYQPSDPVTVVFMNPPLEGDLLVDNKIDILDLLAFLNRWLAFSDATFYNAQGKAAWDLFERADINRDYVVDLADFTLLARNWLTGL